MSLIVVVPLVDCGLTWITIPIISAFSFMRVYGRHVIIIAEIENIT